MPKVLVTVKELTKTYRDKKNPDVQAVKGVSFSLPDKGLVFILGKSGCGKSTLLNLLGGLDGFDGGDILVNGKSMKSFSAKDYDDYRNNCVGFVFQENNLLNEYSVKHNVGLALELKSEKNYDEKLNAALKSVELEGFGDRKCNRLSGGQKQRVAIARAIVKDPEMLLCDEPTGALDSETGEAIFGLLKKISEKTLVIVVSHDREAAETYGDRVIELKDGKIVSDTSAEEYEQPTDFIINKSKHSRLSVKQTASYSVSFLTARPIRLIFCILICLLSFTVMCLCDIVSAYDKAQVTANAFEGYKTSHLIYTKRSAEREHGKISLEYQTFMDDEDYANVKSLVKADRLDKVYLFAAYFNALNTKDSTSDDNIRYDVKGLSGWGCPGFTELDEKLPEDYGFTLYGDYPKAYDEVVITEHYFKSLKSDGYRIDNHLVEIADHEDIIGKTVSVYTDTFSKPPKTFMFSFKVVGVLDTKVNEDYYGRYFYDRLVNGEYPDGYEVDEDEQALISGIASKFMDNGMQNILYCAPGFYKDVFLKGEIENTDGKVSEATARDILTVVSPLPDNLSAVKYNADIENRYSKPITDKTFFVYTLDTPEAYVVSTRIDHMMSIVEYAAKYVTIGLIIISTLFVLYFTSGIVAEKKREIGILRALGASSGDVGKIFALQNALFILVIVLLSSILGIVGGVIINSYFKTSLYLSVNLKIVSFTFRQFGLLLGVAAASVIVGCAIPIIKLLRKKPVDVIAGR